MVSNYKIRQELFHALNPNPGDLDVVIPYDHVKSDELAFQVVDYLLNKDHVISYPAKSYAVAVIYAHLLEQHFGVPFGESLNDPMLLYGNDPHYVPYTDDPEVYHTIHQNVCLDEGITYGLLHEFPQVVATVDYFNREFFINPNPYFDNANLHK